jgi:D-sedoheptulose 7-phosphate isomerase
MKHTAGYANAFHPTPALPFTDGGLTDGQSLDDFILASEVSFKVDRSSPITSMPPALDRVYEAHLIEHKRLFEVMLLMRHDIETTAQLLAHCLEAGGKILLCGDGHASADAQRFAADLKGCLTSALSPCAPVAVMALDCLQDDAGDPQALAREVDRLGAHGDCLIAISSTGDEEATVMAVKAARRRGMTAIALTSEEGRLNRVCEQVMAVPATSKARVQEAHLFIAHTLCALLEARLKPC